MTIAEQLHTLSIYVPPPVTRLILQNPHRKLGGTWQRFHAATAFADISGFTHLAEVLASAGVRGAEELTAILSQVFEALITTVESHGGQVVKFGGDALSLVWPCEKDRLVEAVGQAARAAFAMQAAMSRFATLSTRHGAVELKMKIGLSAGEVLEMHAGGEFGRWEYVLAGTPMASMSHAENHAQAGQIVADAAAWRLLAEQSAQADELAPGFYLLTHPGHELPPTPLAAPDWHTLDSAAVTHVAAVLRSYIPGAISSSLETGYKGMLAELKPMTVCFVGFDGIDFDRDPEAGLRLVNFMRDAQKMIYHYEGSVNKLAVGDKGNVLLVLFGAPPFFHEDDEVRAVACALALVKVAARHRLEASIGLATGPLFAGPLGAPQRREYTVIGDTVNLAARLMQNAGPGQVWVDRSVQSQARRFFEYQDLGEIQVKGKTEPRHVYLALHEKEQDQEELVLSYLQSSQELTGRDKELKIIDSLADQVWHSAGQVLLLSGEAGVGKSRLAADLVRRWMERGGVSYGGDCVSYGQKTPYLPWRSILSTLAGLSPRLPVPERLARLERLLHRLPIPVAVTSPGESYWLDRLPLLADLLGLEAPETSLTSSLSDDLRRDNIFAAIRAIVLAEAHLRPTLILLEDTHWSDELSLELAVNLANELGSHPLWLVLAHRPLGNPVPLAYQRLLSLPYTRLLPVEELEPEAGVKLAQAKLGVKSLPPALAELISRKGQGNPLFIEELVNSLLSLDTLKIENGECQITGDLDKLELPDTVQKVVLARIDRLPEAEKITLKVAAAIGRTFQRDLLEAVHPWVTASTTLNEHLDRLQAEDFTRQEAKESNLDFLFKHVITQEVAYETMLYSQRRDLHATIGAVLEGRYAHNEGEIIDLLAYHYARSNRPDQALKYLRLAGQKALDGYANEAAIAYFSDALAVAGELELVKVQYDLLAGREQAYSRLGNRMAQVEDLTRMKQLALAEGNLTQQLETGNRRLLLAANLGDYHEAIRIAQKTLALAQQHGYQVWAARTLVNLGIAEWRQGRYDRARAAFQQALEIDGAAADDQLKATSLNYLGLIHTQMSDYEQARQDYQQALDLYHAVSDRGGEAGCANNLGLLEASLGRYEQAQHYYAQALSTSHTIGDRLREGISLNTLGQVQTILGDYYLAQDNLERSLSLRNSIGDRRGAAFCLHDLGHLYLARGQADEAVRHFHAACDLRKELNETGNYIASLAAKGQASLAAGEVVLAYQCLYESLDALQNGSGSGEYPPQAIWWVYAQVCRARGDETEVHWALRQAYALITAKADLIHHSELRRSYLENVRINAAILAEMAQANSEL